MSEDSSDRKQFGRCLEIYGISRYGFSRAYLHSCQDELGRYEMSKVDKMAMREIPLVVLTHEWEDGKADMKDSTACESDYLLGGH